MTPLSDLTILAPNKEMALACAINKRDVDAVRHLLQGEVKPDIDVLLPFALIEEKSEFLVITQEEEDDIANAERLLLHQQNEKIQAKCRRKYELYTVNDELSKSDEGSVSGSEEEQESHSYLTTEARLPEQVSALLLAVYQVEVYNDKHAHEIFRLLIANYPNPSIVNSHQYLFECCCDEADGNFNEYLTIKVIDWLKNALRESINAKIFEEQAPPLWVALIYHSSPLLVDKLLGVGADVFFL